MGFEFKVSQDTEETTIGFHGIFDESAVLPKPEDFFKCKKLIVDFKGLKFMNSAGIAIYLRFLQEIEEKGIEFKYRHCPRTIVSQINTIMGFLPAKGDVESFYLPVFCQKCQKNFDFLVESKDFEPKNIEVRELTKDLDCAEMPGCKKHHSIDVIEKSYFRFLNRDKQEN